jgi:hypothetical protein
MSGDDTSRSVPTEDVSELLGMLEDIKRTREAQCRLCGESVDVSEAENWGDVFEALAEHGEQFHEWDDRNGWSVDTETPQNDGEREA